MAQGKNFFDDVKKELECSVCQELFSEVNEPKILKCLHTFCKNCLEAWLRMQREGQLSCPTCRQITECPNSNINSLPSNLFYKQMVEIVEAYSGTAQEDDSLHCGNCEEKKPLKFYCFACNTFLCEECAGAHSKWKLFKGHHVKEIGKFESSDVQDYARKSNVCKQHNDELRFYCESCNICICRDCAILEHRDDKNHNIVSLEQGFENKKSGITGKMQDVKAIASRLSDHKQMLERQRIRVLESIDKATSEIHQDVEQRIRLLRQHESTMIEQVLEQKASFLGAFSSQIASLDQKLMEIDNSLSFGSEVLDRENLPEILNVEEILDQRFQELSSEFRVDLNQSCVKYVPNNGSSMENGVLGKLILIEKEPLLTIASGRGLNQGTEEEDSSFRIVTRDTQGLITYSESNQVSVDIRSVETGNSIATDITDSKTGFYKVKYKPNNAGKYQVSITMNGDAIMDSPFLLEVKENKTESKGDITGIARNTAESSGLIRSGRRSSCDLCNYVKRHSCDNLSCGHQFCNSCLKSTQFLGYCAACEGVKDLLEFPFLGDQPQGHMSWRTDTTISLPGYEDCGTIIISCNFDRGIQGKDHPNPGVPYCCYFCTFYLPDNKEGRELCILLRRVFNTYFMFTIAENSVVCNDLELKTSREGGPANCGYPDQDYLDRLKRQLADKGFFC